MAVAKWATVGTRSANIASTSLNSLGIGSTSAFVTYDNSTNRDLYAAVTVKLGSLTPTTGGSITLRVFVNEGTDVNDDTGSVGGGDTYTAPLTTSTGAKVIVFPLVRLYPFSMRLQITNGAGVSFNAANNELYVRPFNEDVT